MAYHTLGRKKESDQALDELNASGENWAFQKACVYAYRGERDKAFELLERGVAIHDTGIMQVKISPWLRNLHADPRWPHFSMAYRQVTLGQPNDSGSANFGETFALYRNAAPLDGQWEIAIQAGVFSLFNMKAPSGSKDLVNADYTVGLLTSYRAGPFSGFIRLHHQSSHLGDEFILNSQTPINRINLSFEEVDLKLSYELTSWLRIYGGGGILVDRDPGSLGRGTSQVGTELTSPWTFWGGKVRPVSYADFQANERSNWRVASSVMAGLQFENARIGDRRLQLLVEYFSGPSPNGQFYTQNTEWIGIGVHLYY